MRKLRPRAQVTGPKTHRCRAQVEKPESRGSRVCRPKLLTSTQPHSALKESSATSCLGSPRTKTGVSQQAALGQMLPVSRYAQPLSARFVRAAADIPASAVFCHHPEQGPQPGRAGAGLLGGNWQPPCKQQGPQASQPCGVGGMGVPPPRALHQGARNRPQRTRPAQSQF